MLIHGWETFRKSVVGHFISVSYGTSTLIADLKNLTKLEESTCDEVLPFLYLKQESIASVSPYAFRELFFITIVNSYF